jgi:hypothetical protein
MWPMAGGNSANDDTLIIIRQSRQRSFQLILFCCRTIPVFALWPLTCVFVRHAPKPTEWTSPT